MVESSSSQDKGERNVGIGVRRRVSVEYRPFPLPGEQLVLADLEILLRPGPNGVERRTVVRPHGTEHGVALPLRRRDAVFVQADDAAILDIGLFVEAPERREIVNLPDVGIARP